MTTTSDPPSPSPQTLSDWLALLEARHPVAIELGLDRVAAVAARLQLPRPAPRVVTVA
jgi:dihydrofolate synthase/folylpolyglutamate synthase